MRRVLTGLLLPALLSLFVLAPMATAVAVEVDIYTADVLLLATEGGPLDGPTPGDPNASENVGAPMEYEPPFIWKASVGLLALMVGIIGLLGGLYYLLVVRPGKSTSTSA